MEIRRDFWLVSGVPVYAVRLEEAAVALGITKNALEQRLKKSPDLARKGADGLLRIRVRDINAIMGITDGLEWDRPTEPPKKTATAPAEKPGNVVPMRRGK